MNESCKIITEDSLISAGYKVRLPKRRCHTRYFVNDNEEYVLAEVQEVGERVWVIIDRDTYEQIGGSNISMKYRKTASIYFPSIKLDGDTVSLHRLVLGAHGNYQVDHINQCQMFCVPENLRECTNTENSINRRDKLGVESYPVKGRHVSNYRIKVAEGNESFIAYLKNEGFIRDRNRAKGMVVMKSPFFDSKLDCYIDSTAKHKKLYEGTRLEEFVYDITNDFRDTMYLLVHHYILHDISYEEMYQMNKEYWQDKNDSGELLKMA